MTTIQAIQAIQAIQMDEEESETCEDGMKTLQMDDIDWSAEVTRIVCVGSTRPKCQTCHREYAAFLEIPTQHPFDMAYVNLPCWHVDYRSGLEVAPDVRVRLLLVAEDEA